MIEKMTKYSFILLNGEEKDFLSRLQELGLLDITRSVKPVDNQSSGLLARAETYRRLMTELEKVFIPEETVPVPPGEDIAGEAEKALKELEKLVEERKAAEKAYAAALHWGTFESEKLLALQEAGLTIHFHSVPAKTFREEWKETIPLSVISEAKTVRFVTVLPAGETDPLPGEIQAPDEAPELIKDRISGLEAAIDRQKSVIYGIKQQIGKIDALYRKDLSALDLYLAGVAASPAAENTLVTLVGFAPTGEEDAVCAALDETGVFYFKEAARTEENPPIKLKNNRFVRMFEVFTDMYGRPAYNEFDPTPFISVFFLLFFAFCMGDAGYGLILIIVGLLLGKVESFKSYSPIVVTLGIGTAVIGFLFHTFFSMDISTWKIFQPIKGIFLPGKIAGYDGTMVMSIVVGVIHLCLAMIVKTWNETKNKGFAGSLGTWGWTLLIVGGIIVGAFSLTGVLNAAATKWVIIVLGVLSALGIFVFNDPKRNKLANIGMGLWDTYNTATGLIGDVLSYLRLYALGLAGSMLGLAFNNIGQMILGDGSNALLWPPFILIVLVGHTLNIAMAALGAFVHPLRLNFLEFFKNSGYEGSGRNFNPLQNQ
ncbi:MAG: hypothetical protein IJL56_02480 [Bacteroidales bacterium]|nr:hypothetical protein [Bacteroidales bacterium]